MSVKEPYKAIFASSPIKCLIGEAKDKYLALASLEQLRAFIPDVNIKSNKDLLPISFNAATPNR